MNFYKLLYVFCIVFTSCLPAMEPSHISKAEETVIQEEVFQALKQVDIPALEIYAQKGFDFDKARIWPTRICDACLSLYSPATSLGLIDRFFQQIKECATKEKYVGLAQWLLKKGNKQIVYEGKSINLADNLIENLVRSQMQGFFSSDLEEGKIVGNMVLVLMQYNQGPKRINRLILLDPPNYNDFSLFAHILDKSLSIKPLEEKITSTNLKEAVKSCCNYNNYYKLRALVKHFHPMLAQELKQVLPSFSLTREENRAAKGAYEYVALVDAISDKKRSFFHIMSRDIQKELAQFVILNHAFGKDKNGSDEKFYLSSNSFDEAMAEGAPAESCIIS